MKYTGNYNLKKPGGSDVVNIEVFNENADIIDAELKKKVEKVAGKDLSENDYTNTEKAEVAKVKNKAEKITVDNHIADNTIIKHKAREIQLEDSKFTANTVEAGMGELFTNVSNGKDLVSGAITGVDESVVIPTEPSFADLAGAIGGISTGKKWASGTLRASGMYRGTFVDGSIANAYCIDIENLDFIPTTIVANTKYNQYGQDNYSSSAYYGEPFIIRAYSNGLGTSPGNAKVFALGGDYKVTLGHCRIPVQYEGRPYTWIAFE